MMKKIINGFVSLSLKMNLLNKLLVTYTLIGILPLTILFFISNSIISSSLEDKALFALNQSFSYVKLTLEKKSEYLLNMSAITSSTEVVQEVLNRDPQAYEKDIITQNKDYQRLNAYFSGIKMNSQLYHVSMYMTDCPIYTSNKDIIFSLNDASEEGWLEKLNSKKTMFIWLAPSSIKSDNELENSVISVVRKIKSANDYNVYLGYLKMDILESEVRNMLNSLSITPNTGTLLINSKYEIISLSDTMKNTSSDLKTIAKKFAMENNIKDESKITSSRYDNNIILSTSISNTDWQMLSITPRIDTIIEGVRIKNYILWLLLGVILLTLFFSYLIARSITRRLFVLVNRMRQVDKDTFNMDILTHDKDEIGYLIQNYNYMMTKIALLMDEKYELGKEVKNAELKALRAQINPHFLYNTLDLINWIAIENNVPQISSLIKSMSKYYKLSLNKGQDIVPLKDELEHIKEYIYIQSMRFDKQIKLVINVTDELMNLTLLKLTLQPIVENSILHGIMKKENPHGTIEINCRIEDNDMIIAVSDNGIGIPPEKIAGILIDSSQDTFHGYGIKNIHTRYKVFYGDRYGLTYKSSTGFGTTVEIRLPIRSQ